MTSTVVLFLLCLSIRWEEKENEISLVSKLSGVYYLKYRQQRTKRCLVHPSLRTVTHQRNDFSSIYMMYTCLTQSIVRDKVMMYILLWRGYSGLCYPFDCTLALRCCYCFNCQLKVFFIIIIIMKTAFYIMALINVSRVILPRDLK